MNPYPIRTVGIPCRAQPDGKQQTPSEKTKMPRDEARVPRCSKKASPKRSTIKCVRHPGQKRRATNPSHNSRARRSLATCKAAARCLFFPLFVTSPIPLPAQPTQSLLAAASGGQFSAKILRLLLLQR